MVCFSSLLCAWVVADGGVEDVGIWVLGAIVALIRQQNVFSLFAMIGGAIWATGNLCTVPIVKCIGCYISFV